MCIPVGNVCYISKIKSEGNIVRISPDEKGEYFLVITINRLGMQVCDM